MELRPYMTDEEANLIVAFIDQYKAKRCLEWGIGGSTVVFSRCASVQEWIGVERYREWIEKVESQIGSHVKLIHVPRSSAPYGTPADIDPYVNSPSIQGQFDFVFIDGDYRWQCLEKASKILSPTGFCMVHDSARKDMHPHFRHFDHYRILTEGEFNAHNDWHQGLTVLWQGDRSL